MKIQFFFPFNFSLKILKKRISENFNIFENNIINVKAPKVVVVEHGTLSSSLLFISNKSDHDFVLSFTADFVNQPQICKVEFKDLMGDYGPLIIHRIFDLSLFPKL